MIVTQVRLIRNKHYAILQLDSTGTKFACYCVVGHPENWFPGLVISASKGNFSLLKRAICIRPEGTLDQINQDLKNREFL